MRVKIAMLLFALIVFFSQIFTGSSRYSIFITVMAIFFAYWDDMIERISICQRRRAFLKKYEEHDGTAKEKFKRILQWLFDAGLVLNFVALLPQPIKMFAEKSSAGVSVSSFAIFLFIQICFGLHGKMNLKSNTMFWGMLASAVVTIATLILCSIY